MEALGSWFGAKALGRTFAALSVACATAWGAAAPGDALASVRLANRLQLADKPNGLAVLGSRWAFTGSVYSHDAMSVLDLPGLGRAAHWRMPALGNPLDWTMERLALSADNRWLFVLNQVRQEVAVVDLTGAMPVASVHLGSALATDIVPSPDGSTFAAVVPGGPTELYDVASGQQTGQLSGGATAVAWGPDRRLYALFIDFHHATLESFDAAGHARVLATYRGYILAPQTGSIAVSPDGRRLYVLYDGLRAYDAQTGRTLGTVRLPYAPGYIGMALSPNGREAMLWAPDFAHWADSPSQQPGYVITHFGYVPGGVIPIDVRRMRPIRANLRSITTPWQVAFTSDSRYAVVSERNYHVDLIASGTSGVDRARYPRLDLANPRGGGSTGSGGTSGTGGNGRGGGNGGSGGNGGGEACHTWNVQGTWTFSSDHSGGPSDGQATLTQSGNSVSGSLTSGGVAWTITGTINGSSLSLTWSAPGQADTSGYDTVSTDGSSISGNYGTFTGHASCTG